MSFNPMNPIDPFGVMSKVPTPLGMPNPASGGSGGPGNFCGGPMGGSPCGGGGGSGSGPMGGGPMGGGSLCGGGGSGSGHPAPGSLPPGQVPPMPSSGGGMPNSF